jgi:glycosyltransferase involved in cell wall biosynthesis
MGEVKELESVYELADIVVNPLTVGTGLKIKMVEAMGFSKAVISTEVGAEGIEGEGTAYLRAGTREEFADCLGRLLNDNGFYGSVCANARKQAEAYNRRNAVRLAEIFNG